MTKDEDKRDKKVSPGRQSTGSSGSSGRTNKAVKQTKPSGSKSPAASSPALKRGSKSNEGSDRKSKSGSGSGRRRSGTTGAADDEDDFDEFDAAIKSLAHKSLSKSAGRAKSNEDDPQTTLWHKDWIDEEDDFVDFKDVYEKDKEKQG